MRIWVIVVAILAGCVFIRQICVITHLREEATVLQSEINSYRNPLSSEHVASYVRALFDGVTFGKYADEGIFTEVNHIVRKEKDLETRGIRLSAKYSTARSLRNYSFITLVICIALAFILKPRK